MGLSVVAIKKNTRYHSVSIELTGVLVHYFLIEKVCFTRKSNQLTRFSDPSICIFFEKERIRSINSRKTTNDVFVAHMKFELSSRIKDKQKTKQTSRTSIPLSYLAPCAHKCFPMRSDLSGKVKALLWADIMQEVSIQIFHICEEVVREGQVPADSCNSG